MEVILSEELFIARCSELFTLLGDVNVARGVIRRWKDVERFKRWRRKNPVKNRKRLQRWRSKNRSKARAITRKASKKYRDTHKNRVLVSNRRYRKTRSQDKRDKDNRRNQEWRDNHPGYYREYYRKNRERIRMLDRNRYKLSVTEKTWSKLRKEKADE